MKLFDVCTESIDEEILDDRELTTAFESFDLMMVRIQNNLSLEEGKEDKKEDKKEDTKGFSEDSFSNAKVDKVTNNGEGTAKKKGILQKMIEAISNAIAAIFKSVGTFFDKIWNGNKTLREKLTEIKNKMETDGVEFSDSDTIDSSTGKGFNLDKSSVDADDVFNVIKGHHDAVKDSKTIYDVVDSISKKNLLLVDKIKDKTFLATLISAVSKKDTQSEGVKSQTAANSKGLNISKTFPSEGRMFNSSIFMVTSLTENDKKENFLTDLNFKIEQIKDDVPKVESVSPAGRSQAEKIIQILETTCDLLDTNTKEFKNKHTEFQKKTKEMEVKIKNAITELDNTKKEDSDKMEKIIKSAMKTMSKAFTEAMRFNSVLGKETVQMGLMVVKYLNKSIV